MVVAKMRIDFDLNGEEAERFEKARSTYGDIVRRSVKNAEFAKFAMFWFIDGFLREDVDGAE